MKQNARAIFAVVMLCFLLSGMAGLIYQIAWARYLSLFLGHTSYAVVAVLVAFMGGLALGNAWFGIRADRTAKPLALYGWLEIGIGIYALVFPAYYAFCHEAFVAVARRWEPGSEILLGLKFVFSFLTILLPTVLMGATFPVLTKFVTRSLAELREKVAALYCINSAGAVVGCWIADFWWIPAIGLEGTVFGGAALNLVVGVVALVVSFSTQEGEVRRIEPARAAAADDEGRRFTPVELRLAVLGIALSGFVAMLYEVAWTRLLGLALGSSTHAFSIMLITFITGIAVGAWIIYKWKRLQRILEAFAWAELALAVTLFVSMFFYGYLPFWFVRLAALLARTPSAFPLYEAFQALICFLVMFIPAVCLGTTLPLVTRIATEELARTGRSVGKVFALNTLGTVLGAVVTGLVLLPWLGLARTFAVGVVLNALIGGLILLRHRLSRVWWLVPPALGVVCVWLAGRQFDHFWQRSLTMGLWRMPVVPETHREFREMALSRTIEYYKDGAGATVNVESRVEDGVKHLSLKVNGKADAGTKADVSTQLLSGHIPMLLRPNSTRALVIGMGSGMTGSAIARHPGVQQVDLVEISPEVVEAARLFHAHNDRIHENPRVRIILEDAKSFLHINTGLYDVIVSEPSNPWMAGVSGVFSQEYYQSCRARLQPDGVMAQWVQIYETNDEALHMVLRTFTSVFPHISIWQPSGGDLVLIGSAVPLKVDLKALVQRFHEPAIKSDMERFDLARLPVLLSLQLVSQHNGMFIPPTDGPIHSDFLPLLEFEAQRAFFVRSGAESWQRFDENFLTRPSTILGEYLKEYPLTEADYKAFGRYFLAHSLPHAAILRSIVFRWAAEHPESTLPMELATKLPEYSLTAEIEAMRLQPVSEKLMELAEKDPEPLRIYASHLMRTYRVRRSAYLLPSAEEAERALKRLIETQPAHQRVYKLHLAELAWDRGDDAACLRLGREAFDPDPAKGGPVSFALDPGAPRLILGRMAESLWRAGEIESAWALCEEARKGGYLRTNPANQTLLDVTYRKVAAYAAGLAATQNSQPAKTRMD